MTDQDDLAAVERAARDLLPALTERLARHGLGEIEVAHGDLRLRVAAAIGGAVSQPAPGARGGVAHGAQQPLGPGLDAASSATGAIARHPVTAPAVGYFVYADGLGPGMAIQKGDPIGWVEMLGMRHDVRAPRGGTVGHLIAESGEAVEYGQPLVDLEDGA